MRLREIKIIRGHNVLATVCAAPPPEIGRQGSLFRVLKAYVLEREKPYRGWGR